MEKLEFKYNDGGRSKYYTATKVGDCVVRAISIASGEDYKKVYDFASKSEKDAGRKRSARNGVSTFRKVASHFGGVWHPLSGIGSGCKAHLCKDEIPMTGNIVCQVSKHLTAVIDGVINDTYDCSREGTRCVYGYWTFNK